VHEWVPHYCGKCKGLGHEEQDCKKAETRWVWREKAKTTQGGNPSGVQLEQAVVQTCEKTTIAETAERNNIDQVSASSAVGNDFQGRPATKHSASKGSRKKLIESDLPEKDVEMNNSFHVQEQLSMISEIAKQQMLGEVRVMLL